MGIEPTKIEIRTGNCVPDRTLLGPNIFYKGIEFYDKPLSVWINNIRIILHIYIITFFLKDQIVLYFVITKHANKITVHRQFVFCSSQSSGDKYILLSERAILFPQWVGEATRFFKWPVPHIINLFKIPRNWIFLGWSSLCGFMCAGSLAFRLGTPLPRWAGRAHSSPKVITF